jgi:hypothetical protein
MAFTETPAEKKKRQDWEMNNLRVAKAKEAKAEAEDLRKFNETTKVDTSENTNAMGDAYKKGGKVKSPTMSFQTYTKTGKKAGMKTVPVKMSAGGSASSRADGCAVRGKTRA